MELIKFRSDILTEAKVNLTTLKHHYHFNDEEHHTIQHHTWESSPTNEGLWERHHNPNIKPYDREEENIKRIDHVVTKHKTPHPLTVYSGIPHHPKHYFHHEIKPGGSVLHHPAYVHGSLSHKTAKDFAVHSGMGMNVPHHDEKEPVKHVLKIHVPEGHHGVYVDHHSFFSGQKEFILPRNTKLRIHPNPKISHHKIGDTHHEIHTWHTTIEK